MVDQAYVNKLNSFELSLKELTIRVSKIEKDLENYVTQKSVQVYLQDTNNAVEDNSKAIRDLQIQVENIVLPDDTRYYLDQSEVEEFRKNYKIILSMIADIDEKYKALVAYTANAT